MADVKIDMSAAKTPPKKRATAKTATGSVVTPDKTSLSARHEGLMGLGQLAQGALMIGKQYADAQTIGMHFPQVAVELAKLAETNEAIARPIDFLIHVGPYGALIQALMPMAMQFAANHGLINAAGMAGTSIVPPEVLDAQMKAQILQMQIQAQKEQQEAMEAMRQMQAAQQQMETEYAESMRKLDKDAE